MSEPSHLNFQYCVARLFPGLGCCLVLCGDAIAACAYGRFTVGLNIHLTMFTENSFVHRLFQARALHQPCVALVRVRCHSVCTNLC